MAETLMSAEEQIRLACLFQANRDAAPNTRAETVIAKAKKFETFVKEGQADG